MICRFGHPLHSRNTSLTRHSRTGKTWTRCLICHAARQRKVRQAKKAADRRPEQGDLMP
jgi:hypothetical protein